MRFKRIASAFFASVLLLVAIQAQAQEFPRPVGYVNDFAHVMTPATVADLEAELRAYKEATGIELAVATVPSLGDMSVEEFATRLFRRWGVGEKGKDNGVLLLVAPTQHKARIEVGYGLEPDLTDRASGQILREDAVPNFRNNDYPAGIKAVAEAIIGHLGKGPFQARLEERQRRDKEQEREREALAQKAGIVFAGLVLLGVAIIPPVVIRHRKRRREELKPLIARTILGCKDHLERVRRENASATEPLSSYDGRIPAKDFADAQHEIDGLPAKITQAEGQLEELSRDRGEKLGALKNQYERLRTYDQELDAFSVMGVIADVERNIQKRAQAEKDSNALFGSVPAKLEMAEKGKSVSEKRLAEAQNKLAQAQTATQSSLVDWLTVYAFLVAADHLLDKEPDLADQSVSGFSASSSSSDSSSGSSGGFGGGDSGGGGASASW